MRPGLLVLSADPAWISRLKDLAGSLGLAVVCGRDPRDLERSGVQPGMAVVDWDEERLAAFRRRFPGCPLLVAVRAGGLAANRLSAALAVGADGFLTKDEPASRLVVRLRSLLGRGRAAAREARLFSQRGDLSLKEASLLRLFLEQPGRLLDRSFLMEAVWGLRCSHVNPEALDKHVAALRRKLGVRGRALKTVRGRGYRWD